MSLIITYIERGAEWFGDFGVDQGGTQQSQLRRLKKMIAVERLKHPSL